MKKILLLAGEESGVIYRDAICKRLTDCEIRGYGDYGFETADLAVMGFWPVLKKIFFFLRVKKVIERAIDEWKPDIVATIDYPGLNLKIARYAKKRGIKTIHIVCPQVWAWKKGRIPKIEKSLDRLCCFFPFEPKLFKKDFAVFVGHPLAAEFEDFRRAKIAETDEKILAMLPGSRIGEIEKILPVLMACAKNLKSADPSLKIVVPAANSKALDAINGILSRENLSEIIEVRNGGARELLRTATAAVVASGTASLEAALARCPTVIVYKVGRILAWFARRVIKGVRHVGLANIIAEKSNLDIPMVELLQEDFTESSVTSNVRELLANSGSRENAVKKIDAVLNLLSSEIQDPIGNILLVFNGEL